MPVLLAANFYLFLYSALRPGASVYMFLNVDKIGLHIADDLKPFSLVNTVVQMWEAGAKPLSVLIAAFSGIWPYGKLVLMMICWLLPLRWMHYQHRERILEVLDTLGKYSFIDSFVLVIMIVSFRYSITVDVVLADIKIDEFTRPNSVYEFCMATMFSLLLTHIMIHFHRKDDEVPINPAITEKISLGSKTVQPYRQGPTIKWFVFFVMIFTFFLLIAGTIATSYEIEIEGLAGSMLGNRSNRTYSFLTLCKNFRQILCFSWGPVICRSLFPPLPFH